MRPLSACRQAAPAELPADAARGDLQRRDQPGAVARQARDHDAERGDDVVAAPDRHADRAGAEAHLLDGGRVVVAEHGGELALEGARLGDRVRRHAGQVGEDALLHRGRRVREQHLADAGGVQREPAADGADDRHAGAAAQPLDVQDLGALAHGEVDGGEGGAVQVVEVRRRELDQPGVVRREQAEVPEPAADHVVAVGRPRERAPRDQLADQPVRGRHRQPGAGREVGQREPAVLLVEGADQRQRPAGDRRARGGDVAGHPVIIPLDGRARAGSTSASTAMTAATAKA